MNELGGYRILTPSGVIADGAWDTLNDIPAKIPDRFEHYFETDDAMVVDASGKRLGLLGMLKESNYER